jgi:hypothetical protein
MVYIHNEILFIHKEEWNYVICSKLNRLGGHYVKWNKPDTETSRIVRKVEGGWKKGRLDLINAHFSHVWTFYALYRFSHTSSPLCTINTSKIIHFQTILWVGLCDACLKFQHLWGWGSQAQGWPVLHSETLHDKFKRTGGVDQVVEYLPSSVRPWVQPQYHHKKRKKKIWSTSLESRL